MKIKTGDMVRVMVGKDKGKEGKVTQTFPELGLVVVEGVRLTVKHISPKRMKQQPGTAKPEGQKVTYSAPIRVENVAMVSGGTVGRVGYKVTEGGQKTRVLHSKKSVKDIG
jgi:large subunit ribosomal protein L24